jgi:hypothetical protein
MKKFFCKLFGHTWVTTASNPKTSWNTDKAMQNLIATPAGEVHFFDECVRCRERREIQRPAPN